MSVALYRHGVEFSADNDVRSRCQQGFHFAFDGRAALRARTAVTSALLARAQLLVQHAAPCTPPRLHHAHAVPERHELQGGPKASRSGAHHCHTARCDPRKPQRIGSRLRSADETAPGGGRSS